MSMREYKSSVFTMLLEIPENALAVYNALNGTDYADAGMVRIQKLGGKVLLSVRNDASFLLDAYLSMYEHQSTYNPNMALRFLLYFSDMMWDYVKEEDYDIYGRKQIPIPTPKFVVFYNGAEERPAKEVLRLSDSYEKQCETYDLDLSCVIYNINPGYNDEMLRKSHVLWSYMLFVDKVRNYQKKENSLEDAINRAIDECIAENLLADFFRTNREKVLEMTVLDFTHERRLELVARDSREEGREEGWEILVSVICKKLRRGQSIDAIAEVLEEPIEKLQPIYDVAMRYAPDYEEEKVLKEFIKSCDGSDTTTK